MPLTKNFIANIRKLYKENAKKEKGKKRGRDQMIAIALNAAGKGKMHRDKA
jgi:hypothetical protein